MSEKIPNDSYVIIMGAMRCGTTSLYEYLAQHPAICPCRVKEPEFFSQNQEHKLKNISRYEDLWEFDKSKHIYALEASTGYTKYPVEKGVAKRMTEYGIEPKLIYIIRDPFERILSHYNFIATRYDKSLSCTEDNIILHTSNYYLQLEKYSGYIPLENILIVDFDELKLEPRTLLQKIYNFLQISDQYFPEDFKVRNKTTLYPELKNKFLISDIWSLIPGLGDKLTVLVRRLLTIFSKDVIKKNLIPEEREIIYNKLKSDMELLHDKYNVDVERWGFKN